MKRLVTMVAALFALGCVQQSAPAPTTVDVSPKPGEILFVPFPNYNPGQSTLNGPWKWSSQVNMPAELEKEIDALPNDPIVIAKYMQKNWPWKDEYDTGVFLSLNQLDEQGYGVCSAFARAWKTINERKGTRTEFVAFWGPTSAHAVAVFKDANGTFRMGSNQYFYGNLDLDPAKTGKWTEAYKAAAVEWYGEKWTDIVVFDEGGIMKEKIRNTELPPQDYKPYTPGRNIFTIKE